MPENNANCASMPIAPARVAVIVMVGTDAAVPFRAAKDPLPAGTPPSAIKPGEFVWVADDAPRGPMT